MRVIVLAALAIVLGRAGDAAAYPQLARGMTCTGCHVGPGGDGPPPARLPIGGDFRARAGLHDHEVATEADAEVTQAEVQLVPRVEEWSLHVAAGFPGGSREHYLMYETGGAYVRAGRFFPVFGLRPGDPQAFVRRRLGLGVLDEPYGIGFGGGGGPWEVHAAGFASARDVGLTVYGELRTGTAAFAAQARFTGGDTDQQTWIGGVYRRWLAADRLMVLAELDLGVQQVRDGAVRLDVPALLGAVGHAAVWYAAPRDVMVGGRVEAHDPDLALESSARHAMQLDVQWLPVWHLELRLSARAEAAGLDLDHPDLSGLLELHYYL